MSHYVTTAEKSKRVASVERQLAAVREHWPALCEKFADREELRILTPFIDRPVAWFAADLRGPVRSRLCQVWNLITSLKAAKKATDNSPHRERVVFAGRLVWWASVKWDKFGYNERVLLKGVPVIVDAYNARFPEGLPEEDKIAYAGEIVRHVQLTTERDLLRVYQDASPTIGGAYGIDLSSVPLAFQAALDHAAGHQVKERG